MEKKVSYPIDATLSDVVNKKCPILYAMKILGSKYKLPILWYLHEKKSTRYNELKRRIPEITNIMLTKSLRELERDGLVERKILKEDPPKEICYSLTENALELLPTLNELYAWGAKQMKMEKNLAISVC